MKKKKMEQKLKKVLKEKTSPAYIIGDKEMGLTIVITDPVMVVHYTPEDLKDPNLSRLNMTNTEVTMGAVVQLLLPQLRGVDMRDLAAETTRFGNANSDATFSVDDLKDFKKLQDELSLARVFGQLVVEGRTICDPDFCIAFPIKPCDVAIRGRTLQPGVSIGDYLENFGDCDGSGPREVPSKPEKFKIDQLNTSNLAPKSPWEKN